MPEVAVADVDALVEKLQTLLAERRFDLLHEHLRQLPTPDLAEVLEAAPDDVEAVLFRLLDKERAYDTFEYFSVYAQERLLAGLGDKEAASIINEMSADDRTALLEEVPGAVTRRLLNLLQPEERKVAMELLAYPEESIGRLMTPDYVAVKPAWTVAEALEHIRKFGRDSETLNTVYVTGPGGVLVDDIRMRELLLVEPETRIGDMMDSQFVALNAVDDQEESVALFRKHDRSALPVVDGSGVLVGIVTVDDVLDVAQEEATEDIHQLGGVAALDEPYLETSLVNVIRKRAVWLVLLFLGQTLTTSVMGVYEAEIANAVVLALFLPLIISSGGNSGSQAAALVTRAMALGEVTLDRWWLVVKRELGAGLALGLLLGTLGFLRVAVVGIFGNTYGEHWFMITLTIGLALVGVVAWGSLVGSVLPLVLKRFGADPAASSTPFVATVVDVTGIVIFFGLAKLILTGTLL